jgi:hypothetical protein
VAGFNGDLQKGLTNAFAADRVMPGAFVPKTAPLPLSNGVSRARITGKAKIGNREEIEINAVGTSP